MSASLIPLACLAGLLVGVTYFELGRLGGLERNRLPIVPALLFAAFLALGLRYPGWIPQAQALGLTLLGVLIASAWVRRRRTLLLEIGALWIIAPVCALVLLHRLYSPGTGWFMATPLLLVLVPLWIGDTLAYLVGKKFGKRLLAPSLSPKKTQEGAIANLVGSTTGAALIGALIGVPMWISVAAGVLIGVLGQAGDLFESGLKRRAGVKDSGALLPGHGGLLDRIDSLLLSAPAVALLLSVAWPPHR